MISQSDAYDRGFGAGKRALPGLRERMKSSFSAWPAEFPASAHLDFAREILWLDRQRLDAKPSLAKFPEIRGWPDLVMAERKGFADATGFGPAEVAFHYNWFYFLVYRLYTSYMGAAVSTGPINTGECTAIFMRDSKEGGSLYGRNCDGGYNPTRPSCDVRPPRRGPDDVRRLWFKGVSCWTMCDEEPTELFPVSAWRVLPDDCRKLPDVVAFLTRYVQYWWACNGIIIDPDLNCVAFEKSSCRVAFRYSDNGTAAVTSCAYLDPEMDAFRQGCLKRSLEHRNYHDDNLPDRGFWNGAEARYRRLSKLVSQAAARGPTLQDMANIVTDRDAPIGERICHSGEGCHPSIPAGGGTWTLRARAAVLHGPNRRTLLWAVDGNKPCHVNPPYLIPGDGVEVKPDWLKGTRPVPTMVGQDDELEPYRQYEFDYPDTYPC